MRIREPVSWTQRFERHARRTVAEAFLKYLEGYRSDNKRRVAYCFKALTPYVGHLLLMDLNDDALAQYKHDRANGLGSFDKPASAGTINLEIAMCAAVQNAACRKWEWIPRTLALSRVGGPRKQPYPLTWEQQDALFAKLPRRWAEGMALFGFNTGVREDELLGLRWRDEVPIPSLDTFVFVLRETKNGEARAVICNSLARLAVERQRGNRSDYVFPSASNRSMGERMSKTWGVWSEAWNAAGLPTDRAIRRGPHNMRHTFLHRLREAGVSREDRRLLGGHGRASIEEHYAMGEIARLSQQAELATKRTQGVILRRVLTA